MYGAFDPIGANWKPRNVFLLGLMLQFQLYVCVDLPLYLNK